MRIATLQVAVVVAAYNLFINIVDRFDQMRSTVPTLQRKRRNAMGILKSLLNTSTIST